MRELHRDRLTWYASDRLTDWYIEPSVKTGWPGTRLAGWPGMWVTGWPTWRSHTSPVRHITSTSRGSWRRSGLVVTCQEAMTYLGGPPRARRHDQDVGGRTGWPADYVTGWPSFCPPPASSLAFLPRLHDRRNVRRTSHKRCPDSTKWNLEPIPAGPATGVFCLFAIQNFPNLDLFQHLNILTRNRLRFERGEYIRRGDLAGKSENLMSTQSTSWIAYYFWNSLISSSVNEVPAPAAVEH